MKIYTSLTFRHCSDAFISVLQSVTHNIHRLKQKAAAIRTETARSVVGKLIFQLCDLQEVVCNCFVAFSHHSSVFAYGRVHLTSTETTVEYGLATLATQ